MTDSTFRRALFVPWGEAEGSLRPSTRDASRGSLALAPGQLLEHIPVAFAVDAKGGFHLLDAERKAILRFSDEGHFEGATTLPPHFGLMTWACLPDAYALLYEAKSGDRHLQCIGRDGGRRWETVITQVDLPNAGTVLSRENRLIVTGDGPMLEFAHSDGQLLRRHDRKPACIAHFLPAASRIVSTVFFPHERRRGVSVYDLDARSEEAHIWGEEWFAPLLCAVGVSEKDEIFIYSNPSLGQRFELIRADLNGNVRGRLPFFGLATDPGGGICSAHLEGRELIVAGHGKDGGQHRFPLPDSLGDGLEGRLRFHAVETDGAFVFDLMNNMSAFEARLVFPPDGPMKKRPVEPGTIGAHLQNFTSWAVDGGGAVYIPLTTPEGFCLIRYR